MKRECIWVLALAFSASISFLSPARATITIGLVPDAADTAAANNNDGDVHINGQNVAITKIGDLVVMDIYVTIPNNDGNLNDDGFQSITPAFSTTTSSLTSLQGIFDLGGIPNIGLKTGAPAFMDNYGLLGQEFDQTDPGVFVTGGAPLTNTLQQGAADGDGPITFLAEGTTWGNGTASLTQPSGTTASSNPFTLIIGTLTWTIWNTTSTSGTAIVHVQAQPGDTGSQTVATYYSDGNLISDISGMPSFSDVVSGPDVIITGVPEPTTLGIIALGITACSLRLRQARKR